MQQEAAPPPNNELYSLRAVLAETQRQLRTMASTSTQTQSQLSQLVTSTGELTTAVRVHEEQMLEVARRVAIIESEETKRRDMGATSASQRSQGLVLMGVQSVMSLLFLLLSILLAHAWK